MTNSKLSAYLGFAAKAGKLQTGYNTCLSLIKKGSVRLLIVAEDSQENTITRMTQKCKSHGIPVRIYGTIDQLSKMTGNHNNSIFAVTDDNFGNVIGKEIDRLQSERRCSN